MQKMNLLCMALAMLAIACSKSDKDDTDVPPPVDPAVEVSTGVYTLVNLAADTAATSGAAAKAFYYSLETQQTIPAAQVQTTNWDIAFTGTYNSTILINNGKARYSPGYGGPGVGGIYLVKDAAIDAEYYEGPTKPFKSIPARRLFDSAFAHLKTVPVADDQLLTNDGIGLDYFGPSTDGWAYYDFYGQQFPQADIDSVGHVCYSMPRTLIIKTAKGNYVKMVVYSIYKGAPELPSRSYKPGFITFKYAIQKDGSKNLDLH
jgi:hypothetical protein